MKLPWRRAESVMVLSSVVDSLDIGAAQLREAPISRWRSIDQQMRRRSITSPDWFAGLWSVQRDAVSAYADLVADAPHAIGLLAMHPDGYVRHASLRVLADRHLSSLLPIAVLRATDWVGPIRDDAIAVLDSVRRSHRHEDLLPSLGLMTERWGSFLARRDYIAQLRSEVLASVETDALIGVLRSLDVRCRQAAARSLVEIGAADDAFAPASVQDDPATLATIINGLSASFWSDRANVDRALESKFSSARSAGFFYLQRLDPDAATTVAEANLANRRATMRDLAQRHLLALGVDVAKRYRDLLDTDRRMALIGLSETGSEADVSAALGSVDSADEQIRAAAVRAAARIGGRAAESAVAAAIGDVSRVVAFTAGRELARLGPASASLDRAWRVAKTANTAHNRRAAFNVFARAGRWDQLTAALRAIASGSDELALEGDRLLTNCLRAWNQSFVEPSGELATEITRLVPGCLGAIDIQPCELLTTSLRPHVPEAAEYVSAWLRDIGSAVRGARSGEWQRQLIAIPVLEPHIGRPIVDEAMVQAMTRSTDLVPIRNAAAALLRSGSAPGRRAFAQAWHQVRVREDWQIGDCHADALRESLGLGTSSRREWQELTANDDQTVADGASSIARWIDGGE